MVMTPSTMVELGRHAPDFDLPDTEGTRVSLKNVDGTAGVLIFFTCNHCPFVKHILEPFLALAREWQGKGVAVVAINSNDADNYPEDSLEKMKEVVQTFGYSFPYLYDATQETAKAYGAACTPDFFLFDGKKRLVYRGQLDGSRPGNGVPVTGEDLSAAIDALVRGEKAPEPQRPSVGCNIKWKKGNEPSWFG